MKYQKIYIYLDDSGKLNNNENTFVYAGFVTTNKQHLEKCKWKTKGIFKQMWADPFYKNHKELKGNNSKHKDKVRIVKMLNKELLTIGIKVNNNKLLIEDILTDKNMRSRYQDYLLRTLIKSTVKMLISANMINPYEPVKLILRVDDEQKSSNGLYEIDDILKEELTKGIINLNYDFISSKTLYNDLIIDFDYENSIKSIGCQMADFIANDNLKLVKKGYKSNCNLFIELP